MTHDTFGTMNLEMLAAMLWEAGWDYVQGTIYRKDDMTGSLVMRDGYYALVAATQAEG